MNAKRLILIRTIILAGLFASASLANAEGTNRYGGSTFAPLDAKAVLATAADITLAKYPDCDDALVDQKMVRVYRADGTGECQDETFTKVLTEKGKRNNRTLSLGYMLPYFTVEVVTLEVVKPGGEVVPVDVAANSKESIDDSQMQMNIYDPNHLILRVNIPVLEIGDIVHSITRQTIERSIMANEYAEESVFEGQGFVRHMTYEVHAPQDRPLKRIALRDEIPGTVKYSTRPGDGSTTIHVWDITNVPRMFDEPAMPSYEMVLQRLYVSTIPDWQTVSKWYWTLSKPHLEATSPEMKKTVAELTAGAKTDLERVKAPFYHVSKKVRYMGLTPEKDRPGFEPHDVKITFDKKYGVCRDKAALLVSLLRAADLKAYPVLINVGTRMDPDVPSVGFNHAIVTVELTPGNYVLMDPTDENTRDLLPYSDGNQSYLVCRPEGEGLKLSPVEPPDENLMTVQTTGTLQDDGRLEAHTQLIFAGVNDDVFRNMLVHMKPDDQRRFFERNLKQAIPGARLSALRLIPADMLDVSETVRAELDFSVPDVTVTADGKSLVSLPWVGNQLGVLKYLLQGASLDKRKYPMRTEVTCGLKETISLKLGTGFGEALSLPSCSPVDDACLTYHQSYDAKKGSFECSRELKLNVVEFSPEQYLRLKDTLKLLEYDERKAPILANSAAPSASSRQLVDTSETSPVDSNAKILESSKELNVTDPHNAIYRVRYSKRILNYAGKIREAELKIDFNPSCQDAKLVRAVVTSKTGQRQEISKGEINVMDAGWNASAKRYTGGKILVANLPGVDIGSTIEVEFEVASKNRPFLSGFEAFQMPDELERKSFKLTAPRSVKLEKLVTGPKSIIKENNQTDQAKQLLQWSAQNVKALPAESQLPPEWIYAAGVEYFVGDLKAYLTELNDTMRDRSSKSAKAKELAGKLVADVKNKTEAVGAIRDFVAKSIREAGPSFVDLPLTELSDADTTLGDGYGHSADRAILLHAMLTAAGLQPEFILASGLPPISAITNVALSFPLPQAFLTPLIRVVADGVTVYLNDTDQYAKLGSTGHDGKMGIVLGSQSPEVVRAAAECSDRSETAYTITLDEKGTTRLGVTRRYYGSEYNRRNRYFSELPPEEKRRYYQEIVSGVSQGARPITDLVTTFDTYPGLEKFSVEIDNYAVVDGKYLYFDLPFTPSLFPPGADHRTLPLLVAGRSDRRVHTEIELPPGFRKLIMAPKTRTIEAPDQTGQVRIETKAGSGKFVISHDLETSPGIVEPKQYAELLNSESTLSEKASRLFLLEKE